MKSVKLWQFFNLNYAPETFGLGGKLEKLLIPTLTVYKKRHSITLIPIYNFNKKVIFII